MASGSDTSGEFAAGDAFRGDHDHDLGDDESDFEFGESYAESTDSPVKGNSKSTKVQNQHFDEAVELSDSGSLDASIDTNDGGSPKRFSNSKLQDRGDSPPRDHDDDNRGAYHSDDDNDHEDGKSNRQGGHVFGTMSHASDDSDEDDTDTSSDDGHAHKPGGGMQQGAAAAGGSGGGGGGGTGAVATDGYNPSDYAHLNVSTEIRELFQYIGRYKPHNIELETKLKCFIPDYIPAVGEIDAFIKVPRPDSQPDDLGLKVLDEPSAHQSDPTVLDLQLRAISKKSNLEPMLVQSLEHADKDPRGIQKWIDSMNDLHRSKPPPQVHYSKPMPDIESLMQVWPEEFEALLGNLELPSADLDMSIHEYVRVICGILDIPVHSNIIQSLHVLFTLFSEFKNNQHFAGGALGGGPNAAGMGMGMGMDAAGTGVNGPGGANIMTMGSTPEGKMSAENEWKM